MKGGSVRYSSWLPFERIFDDYSEDASKFANCFGIFRGRKGKCHNCYAFKVCRELRKSLEL